MNPIPVYTIMFGTNNPPGAVNGVDKDMFTDPDYMVHRYWLRVLVPLDEGIYGAKWRNW